MKSFQLKPGNKVDLGELDPGSTEGFEGDKKQGLAEAARLVKELDSLQEMLYAQHKHKVLIVLQGMDTSGKDGTIRRVFEGVNPQGVKVASFKVPTAEEAAHDYLWRIHAQMPASGEIVIFNRSHYEDVLVVRVHKLVPAATWRARFAQINDFEKMLSQEGTLIIKFFLHIGFDEQRKRLRDRLADQTKLWKYNPEDLKERTLWKDYMKAYEDVLTKTTTDYAPWCIVPSDRRWFRDLVIADAIVKALRALKMEYPRPGFDLEAAKVDLDQAA
jgi:PPK2 family polyphosphate:nucleotide phosphotransferase